MPKILTRDERYFLKKWAKAYEEPCGSGIKAVAHRMGYSSRVWLSRVLNDDEASTGMELEAWKRLLRLLLDREEATGEMAVEAIEGGAITTLHFADYMSRATRQDLRTMRQRERTRAALKQPERGEGRVEVAA